jgi:hypothetical protein
VEDGRFSDCVCVDKGRKRLGLPLALHQHQVTTHSHPFPTAGQLLLGLISSASPSLAIMMNIHITTGQKQHIQGADTLEHIFVLS